MPANPFTPQAIGGDKKEKKNVGNTLKAWVRQYPYILPIKKGGAAGSTK